MRSTLILLLLFAPACATEPGPPGFRAGFGRVDITPEIPEPWTDANADGRFSAEDGDTFEDRNGNGVFDAVWLAGSFEGRAAASIADSLTATAMVVDDGQRRIAMVSIDVFGMILDDVEDVRSRIPEDWGVDRALVIATGTHSAPDIVGWWTPTDAALYARWAYLEQAKEGIVDAIGRAVDALEPARMQLAEIDDSDVSPVVDVRPPYVYDPGIRLMRFVDSDGEGIGTVVSWTCTPELMGATNTAVSTDFVGALRAGLENGVGDDGPGLGGVSLFVNGAFGGRLTVPEEVRAPLDGSQAAALHMEKVATVGASVSRVALDSLGGLETVLRRPSFLYLTTSELRIPIDNSRVASRIDAGNIRRSVSTDSLLRTEMDLLLIGEAWLLFFPGEVFPEQINGGITALPGSDFVGNPEAPAIRPRLHGTVNIVASNGSDAFGPIIPYMEWDAEEPHIADHPIPGKEEERAVAPISASIMQRGFVGLMRSVMTFVEPQKTAPEEWD